MRSRTTSFLSMVRNHRHWQSASEGGPDTWVPRRASGPLFCFGEISAQDRPMSTKLAPFPSLMARATAMSLLAALFGAPCLAQRKPDLSRLVVVGDSLSAGFQSGSLLDVQQMHGYGAVVAAQA